MRIKIFIKSPERQFQPPKPTILNEIYLSSVKKRKRTTSDKLAANEAIEKHLANSEEDCQTSNESKRRTRHSVANEPTSTTVPSNNFSQTSVSKVKRPYRKKEFTTSIETTISKTNQTFLNQITEINKNSNQNVVSKQILKI